MPLISPNYLTLAKDLAVIIASFTGIWLAMTGLYTWRRQLKGQTKYELARRILVSLYRHRNELNILRRPVNWVEWIGAEDEDKKRKRIYIWRSAYSIKQKEFQEISAVLHADMLDAEVLLNPLLQDIFRKIFLFERYIACQTDILFDVLDPDGMRNSIKEEAQVYSFWQDVIHREDREKFDQEIELAYSLAECKLKGYLNP